MARVDSVLFWKWWLIVLSLIIFFIAILADLFESKLKRTSGKKIQGIFYQATEAYSIDSMLRLLWDR